MRNLWLFFLLFWFVLFTPVVKANKPIRLPAKIYKKLQATELLIEAKSYQQAEQNLQDLLLKAKLESHAKAIILKSLSSVYALQGQYKKAIKVLTKALESKFFPLAQQPQAWLNLGQLYLATEEYNKAIQILAPKLTKNPNKNAQLRVLVANAYFQLKQYKPALSFVKQAISSTKTPKESWYRLNLAIYFALEKYSDAVILLKKLIQLNPNNKTYWRQLVLVYKQLEQYNNALSVKHIVYQNGLITIEEDLLDLANLFLVVGMPYQAATILQTAFSNNTIKNTGKNWETLADVWIMAKEYVSATKALEKSTKYSKKSSLFYRLAQVYIEQEQWKLAIEALNVALSKGNLKNPGNVYLLLGLSYYELYNIKYAKQAFLKATKYRKNKKTAQQWLDYLKT